MGPHGLEAALALERCLRSRLMARGPQQFIVSQPPTLTTIILKPMLTDLTHLADWFYQVTSFMGRHGMEAASALERSLRSRLTAPVSLTFTIFHPCRLIRDGELLLLPA